MLLPPGSAVFVPIRRGADGNQMIPAIVVTSDADRPQGIFGAFLRRSHRAVLVLSAYAYQKAVS
jgi:hypothetical protein